MYTWDVYSSTTMPEWRCGSVFNHQSMASLTSPQWAPMIKYRLSIKYWLLIWWRPMRAQTGLLNTHPHLTLWQQQSKGNLMLMSSDEDITMTTTTDMNWTHETKMKQMTVNPRWNNMATPDPTKNKQTNPNSNSRQARRIRLNFYLFFENSFIYTIVTILLFYF